MNLQKLRPYITFTLFILLIGFTTFLTEVFQTPKTSVKELIENIQLFRKEELSRLQTIILTNKNGIFQFEKNQTNELSPWLMSAPEQRTANAKVFEKLLNSLATSKIKKSFPSDENNLENFSLKNSTTTLEFINELNKKTKVTLGLQNSIDKSLFVKIETLPDIYQVDSFDIDLSSLLLSDLIESNLFALNKQILSALQIYNGAKNTNTLVVNIVKNPPEIKGWRLSEKEQASEDKIFHFIEKLSNLKAHEVLEITNDTQRKKVSQLLQAPKWIVTLEDLNKNIITYTVTSVFTEFPNYETKGESYFIVKISNQENFYLFKKESMDVFDITKDNFVL